MASADEPTAALRYQRFFWGVWTVATPFFLLILVARGDLAEHSHVAVSLVAVGAGAAWGFWYLHRGSPAGTVRESLARASIVVLGGTGLVALTDLVRGW